MFSHLHTHIWSDMEPNQYIDTNHHTEKYYSIFAVFASVLFFGFFFVPGKHICTLVRTKTMVTILMSRSILFIMLWLNMTIRPSTTYSHVIHTSKTEMFHSV